MLQKGIIFFRSILNSVIKTTQESKTTWPETTPNSEAAQNDLLKGFILLFSFL